MYVQSQLFFNVFYHTLLVQKIEFVAPETR